MGLFAAAGLPKPNISALSDEFLAEARVLRRYSYPPDRQGKATRIVRRQAELRCGEWAA